MKKFILLAALIAVTAGLLIYHFASKPVPVQIETVTTGGIDGRHEIRGVKKYGDEYICYFSDNRNAWNFEITKGELEFVADADLTVYGQADPMGSDMLYYRTTVTYDDGSMDDHGGRVSDPYIRRLEWIINAHDDSKPELLGKVTEEAVSCGMSDIFLACGEERWASSYGNSLMLDFDDLEEMPPLWLLTKTKNDLEGYDLSSVDAIKATVEDISGMSYEEVAAKRFRDGRGNPVLGFDAWRLSGFVSDIRSLVTSLGRDDLSKIHGWEIDGDYLTRTIITGDHVVLITIKLDDTPETKIVAAKGGNYISRRVFANGMLKEMKK